MNQAAESCCVSRREYASAYERFCEVAGDFGLPLDADAKNHLKTLITLIDLIDQHYDGLETQEERADFRQHIVEYLTGKRDFNSADFCGFSDTGCLLLQGLNTILDTRECRDQFVETVSGVFSTSEVVKTTRDIGVLVWASMKEGELTADLVLMVVGATRDDFIDFWREVGGVANIADDVMDAKGDVADGERSCDLGLRFYAESSVRVLYGMSRIIAAYPRKRSLLRYMKAVPSSVLGYSRG